MDLLQDSSRFSKFEKIHYNCDSIERHLSLSPIIFTSLIIFNYLQISHTSLFFNLIQSTQDILYFASPNINFWVTFDSFLLYWVLFLTSLVFEIYFSFEFLAWTYNKWYRQSLQHCCFLFWFLRIIFMRRGEYIFFSATLIPKGN